jgi:hypothetical protein
MWKGHPQADGTYAIATTSLLAPQDLNIADGSAAG